MLFAPAQRLAEFFGEAAQRKLPASCRLVICGVGVAHVNWDGDLIRPRLVETLRTFVRPVQWFSAEFWEPEDRAVVAHILGEGRLHVSAAASPGARVPGARIPTRIRWWPWRRDASRRRRRKRGAACGRA